MLKVDVEFSEWDALNSMLTDGLLKNVKQLAIEVHCWRDTVQDYVYFSRIFNGLLNAGFERWYFESTSQMGQFRANNQYYFPQKNINFININFLPGVYKTH